MRSRGVVIDFRTAESREGLPSYVTRAANSFAWWLIFPLWRARLAGAILNVEFSIRIHSDIPTTDRVSRMTHPNASKTVTNKSLLYKFNAGISCALLGPMLINIKKRKNQQKTNSNITFNEIIM